MWNASSGAWESDAARTMLAETQPPSALCARYVSASGFVFWHLEQVLETLNNKWHADTLLERSTWAGARHSLKPDTLTLHALFAPFFSFPYHTITHVPTGNVRNGKCSMPHWPNNWTMVPEKLSSFMVPFILLHSTLNKTTGTPWSASSLEKIRHLFFLHISKPGMLYRGALKLKADMCSALGEKTNFRGS